MNTAYHKEVQIPVDDTLLEGELMIPDGAKALVIFSHGSGSSRKSIRNQAVAHRLQQHGIGALLFDLLTEGEDKNYYNRFNISLLASRLVAATEWLSSRPQTTGFSLGYFGASTGAASALMAAAVLPQIRAVVSRGGRPDLAKDVLPKITAPVLLVVGSLDYEVLELNDEAYALLRCDKKLKEIEGASHLFEEGDTLDRVADEAIAWFEKYLLPINESNRQVYV